MGEKMKVTTTNERKIASSLLATSNANRAISVSEARGSTPMTQPKGKTTEPDDLDYVTRVDVNIAILREIAKIRFRERFRQTGPLIAQGIVNNLAAAGVDFSKVDCSRAVGPTDEELDAIYEDFK